jgi:Protein of unknown function (DUF3027)
MVGEHLGAVAEADRVVTHLFACLSRSYVGWRWAVTVARAARSRQVTVSESLLLPGPDSLVAPEWVPWTERVRPGDLRAGDLMPASEDDERLVPVVAIEGAGSLLDWDDSDSWGLGSGLPGFDVPGMAVYDDGEPVTASSGPAADGPQDGAASDDQDTGQRDGPAPDADRPGDALLPRRVMSAAGRDESAIRWYTGSHGPQSALATAAPGHCLTCGFIVRLRGPLGRVFGVCANEFAPDDGKVVSVDHGCGAHSDAGRQGDAGPEAPAPAVDEMGFDMMTAGTPLPESVLETLDNELL